MNKKCVSCGCRKNISFFLKDDLSMDGKGNLCRSCRKSQKPVKPSSNKREPAIVPDLNIKISSLAGNAKRRGIDFSLTKADIKNLLYSGRPCHYCGLTHDESRSIMIAAAESTTSDTRITALKRRCGAAKHRASGVFTLDRIDNSLGYTSGNTVQCCFICNVVKGDFFSESEMLAIMPAKMKWYRNFFLNIA